MRLVHTWEILYVTISMSNKCCMHIYVPERHYPPPPKKKKIITIVSISLNLKPVYNI